MRTKTLALTGVAATGALVLGTAGGAYACLPGDDAGAPVSSASTAAIAARIDQIEALIAKYDDDPQVSQEVAEIAALVESYFTDPEAYQARLTGFEDTAAYQRLQDKLAAIRAADTTTSSTPSTSTSPSPGTLPTVPVTPGWCHHHGWHRFGGYGPAGYGHDAFQGRGFQDARFGGYHGHGGYGGFGR